MTQQLVVSSNSPIIIKSKIPLPSLITQGGKKTQKRFWEFFTANIRNSNTRQAYFRAVLKFLNWCDARGLTLKQIEPVLVAAYIEQHPATAPTVKQHLAAIRMFLDWMVIGQVLRMNPAAAVRGPAYVIKKGKTPVLSAVEARQLLDSIDTSHLVGLRDKALIGVMVYSFARVSAVIGMKVEDYYQNGKRWWIRLHEKGGKFHEVPMNHKAEAYLDAYLEAAGIQHDKKSPLFRSAAGKTKQLTTQGITRRDVLAMVKRRTKEAGMSDKVCCHTFRATGITAYLENGGTLESAQKIAAHESARTTKLYDRRGDQITLEEVERIAI